MPGTFSNLTYHVVFSTANRLPLIAKHTAEPLHAYLGGVVKGIDGVPLAIGGMPDHVHLIVGIPTKLAIADVVRAVKSSSSKWMNENNPAEKFGWQRGYGAFTVSQSLVFRVVEYVARQREHHQTKSFTDEFAMLLQRHRVEYDERFLP
jgi:REP element-mobilizing transposase RayT